MKRRPWLLWTILWVFGVFLITFKNRVIAGAELELGRIIFLNAWLSVVVVPFAIVVYFVMRFIFKAVGAKDFLEGDNAMRNTALAWLVLFVLVFMFPLFK